MRSSSRSTLATSMCPRSRCDLFRWRDPALSRSAGTCAVKRTANGMEGDRLVLTNGARRRTGWWRQRRNLRSQRGLAAEERVDRFGADRAAAGAHGRDGRGAAGLGDAERRRRRLRQTAEGLDVERRVGRRATVAVMMVMRAAALSLARRRQPTDVVLALHDQPTLRLSGRTQHTRTFSRPSKLSSSVVGGSASSTSAASMICRLSSPRPAGLRGEAA